MSRAEDRERAAAEAASRWAATVAGGGRVEIGLRRGRLVRLVLTSAVFVALGVIMLVTGDTGRERAVAVTCIVFFGLGVLVLAWQLARAGVQVVVDGAGVQVPRWTLRVPWSVVEGAVVLTVQRHRLVQLLVDPAFHEQWSAGTSGIQAGVARANRALLDGRHAFSLPGPLDVDEEVLARWLSVEARARTSR